MAAVPPPPPASRPSAYRGVMFRASAYRDTFAAQAQPETPRQAAIRELAEALCIPPAEVFPTDPAPISTLTRLSHPYGRRPLK